MDRCAESRLHGEGCAVLMTESENNLASRLEKLHWCIGGHILRYPPLILFRFLLAIHAHFARNF
jgi:hypothetical protein